MLLLYSVEVLEHGGQNIRHIDPMQKWLPLNIILLFVFKIASLTSFGITNSLQFLSQKRG